MALSRAQVEKYHEDWYLSVPWYFEEKTVEVVQNVTNELIAAMKHLRGILWKEVADLQSDESNFDKITWSIEELKLESHIKQEVMDSLHKVLWVKFIYEKDNENVRSIMSFHQRHKNEILNRFVSDPWVISMMNQLMWTESVYVKQSKINQKKGKWEWVTDTVWKKWSDHNWSMYWNLKDKHPTEDLITVFVYLSEHTQENWAVYALKWSHKWRDIEQMDVESHPQVELYWEKSEQWDTAAELSIQYTDEARKEYYDKYEKVYLIGKPWDVIFSHPWLLHWSEDNTTTKNRDLSAVVYASTNNLPQNHSRANYLNERDYSPV